MIKRDGVAIMNARSGNVSIAKETIKIIKAKQYIHNSSVVDISSAIDNSIQNTKLYDTTFQYATTSITTIATIAVINETTSQSAKRLLDLGQTDIVALNFASARNVGGGFLGGAIAQEEDLCRASALYACIKSKPMFYNTNILCEGTLYTDGIIYSPNVPFFRNEKNEFLEEPFSLSIITAPAPNVSAIKKNDYKAIRNTLECRAIKILRIAELHGHKNIILGAWGCGAFGNDPTMVAECFKLALNEVPAFSNVTFAVYDTRPNTPLLTAFKKVLL